MQTSILRAGEIQDLRSFSSVPRTNAIGLRAFAGEIRHDVVTSIAKAGCGHPGGSLAVADALAVIYANHLTFDPAQPENPNRDRFVLSAGHTAPALYSTLAHSGFFPVSDLEKLRQIDSHLQGHADMLKTPGVDFSTGRLGAGFAAAVGTAIGAKLAHALKINNRLFRTFVTLGDGEAQEGIVTEAADLASTYGLNNLTAFLSYNGLQIDGKTSDVSSLDLAQHFADMGWAVATVDGHNVEQLDLAFEMAKANAEGPTLVLGHTVKGKGVSFMEGKAEWHGRAPKGQEITDALLEIERKGLMGVEHHDGWEINREASERGAGS